MSLLWTIVNLPTFISLVLVLFTDFNFERYILLFLLFLSICFNLFPSVQTAFSLMRDLIIKEKIPTHLFKSFFRLYKQNYKRSILAGFIFCITGILIILNISLLNSISYIAQSLFIILGMIFLLCMINYFSFQAHYYLSFKKAILNSIILTFSHPKYTVKILLILGISSVISFFIPIMVFFSISILVNIMFFLFHKEIEEIKPTK